MDLRDGREDALHGRPDRPRAACPASRAEDAAQVYYYALLPNLLLNLHPDYMLTSRSGRWRWTAPRSCANGTSIPTRSRARASTRASAIEFWDLTNRQDWELSELAQEGISSRGYRPGPYSNREELLHALDRWSWSAPGNSRQRVEPGAAPGDPLRRLDCVASAVDVALVDDRKPRPRSAGGALCQRSKTAPRGALRSRRHFAVRRNWSSVLPRVAPLELASEHAAVEPRAEDDRARGRVEVVLAVERDVGQRVVRAVGGVGEELAPGAVVLQALGALQRVVDRRGRNSRRCSRRPSRPRGCAAGSRS